MSAQQLNIDNIANNLANSNTVGYKSRPAQFQDLMYQTLVQPGAQAGTATVVPTGLQLGLGVRAVSNEVVFQQGDFSNTNNPLDMVIQGPGFFQIKQTDGVVTGNRTRVKVVKNKVAPPFTEAEFDIMYNEGISSVGALLDVALEQQIIEKRGSWLNYKGTQLAQGRDAAKEVLKSDKPLYDEIEAAVKVKLDEDKS